MSNHDELIEQLDSTEEYSLKWFRWHKLHHPEWLGTQAYALLELYEDLLEVAGEQIGIEHIPVRLGGELE